MMRDGLDIILPAVYILFGPIVVILNAWLPQYAKSLELFSILFPICVFDGKMDIVGTTFFKVLRQEKRLLKLNVITFTASVVTTTIGTYVFHSIEFTLIAVMLILGIRSTYSELIITQILDVKTTTLGFFTLLLSLIFIVIAQLVKPMVASLIFVAIYLGFLRINKKNLHSFILTAQSLKR